MLPATSGDFLQLLAAEAREVRLARGEREAQEARERAQAREAQAARDAAAAARDAAEARQRAELREARDAAEARQRSEMREARAAADALERAEARKDLHLLIAALHGQRQPQQPQQQQQQQQQRYQPSAPFVPASSPVTRDSTPVAGGGGGGGGGSGGGKGGGGVDGRSSPASVSSLGQQSRKSQASARELLLTAARELLLTAFAAAAPAAQPLPAPPFPASSLLRHGLAFAHRQCTAFSADGSPLTLMLSDFEVRREGGVLMLQPAGPTGKPGMSFFILTSEEPAAVHAAHSFRGAGALGGCQAFPLNAVPAALSLVVDAVQVAAAGGAPVLLHASLAPRQAMSMAAYMAALVQWQGVQPCVIEGSAGAHDWLGSCGSSGAVSCNGEDEEEEEEEEEVEEVGVEEEEGEEEKEEEEGEEEEGEGGEGELLLRANAGGCAAPRAMVGSSMDAFAALAPAVQPAGSSPGT